MKNLFLTLMLVFLTCSPAAAETFAAQGSTVVPAVFAVSELPNNIVTTQFFLTNITDTQITCQVTVYDEEGNDVTINNSEVRTGGVGRPVVSDTGTFTIPPHGSRQYIFRTLMPQANIIGHATIKWTSDNSKLQKALIGTSDKQQSVSGSFSDRETLINNGHPF